MSNLDLGDRDFGAGNQIKLPSNASGSAGDFVTFNSSGNVKPVSAADDDIVGVLGEASPGTAGDPVKVHTAGVVLANVANSVSAGDVVEPDGSNNGRVTTNSQGYSHNVQEGSSSSYRLSQGNPIAVEDADSNNEGKVLL